MILADLLTASLVTAGLLMVIFKTTAIEEYASFLRLEKALGLDRWKEERLPKWDAHLSPPACPTCQMHQPPVPPRQPPPEPMPYMTWARQQAIRRKPGFLRWAAMLATCPFCLGLWIAAAAAFVFIHPWPMALATIPGIYAAAIAIFRRVL